MEVIAPFYYHSLPAALPLFERGVPILTYHKLGRKAFRARLKGLYLSEAVFKSQLLELLQGGYRSAPLGEVPALAKQKSHRHIGITFDDGFASTVKLGLVPLAQTGFAAVQFLPADLLGQTNEWDVPLGERAEPIMNVAQVREWLAAGHQIGSHTCTHPWLHRLTRGEAREEIFASKKKLEDLFGVPVEHFCYPYGDWNPALRDLVEEAGYRSGCTTEFGVNDPGADVLALKRITVRYPSRNWHNFKTWIVKKFHRA